MLSLSAADDDYDRLTTREAEGAQREDILRAEREMSGEDAVSEIRSCKVI